MSQRNNSYAMKRRRRALLNGTETAALHPHHSLITNPLVLTVGGLAGAGAGLIAPKQSNFYIGLAGSLLGLGLSRTKHKDWSFLVTAFSTGFMLTPIFSKQQALNGPVNLETMDGFKDDVKDRWKGFKDFWHQRLTLKEPAKTSTTTTPPSTATAPITNVAGLGEIQFFSYPNTPSELPYSGMEGQDEFAGLDAIEEQLNATNEAFQQEIAGLEEMGELELMGSEDERLYGPDDERLFGPDDDKLSGNDNDLGETEFPNY